MIRAVYFSTEELERLEARAAESRLALNFLVRQSVRRELGLPPLTPKPEQQLPEEARRT